MELPPVSGFTLPLVGRETTAKPVVAPDMGALAPYSSRAAQFMPRRMIVAISSTSNSLAW